MGTTAGYGIITTKSFDKSLKKLFRKNQKTAQKVVCVLEALAGNPFCKGLRTHKVQSRNYGIAFSSRVTGDIRVIWDFVEDRPVIVALAVGGHEGSKKVY